MDSKKALELSRKAYPTNENLRIAYMLGLNKGWDLHDEHPRKGLVDIEKVCEWLTQNFLNYMKYHHDGEKVYYTYNNEKLIDDLKKAMGGE